MGSVDFATEVVTPVSDTAKLLGDKVEDILPDYAPSIVAGAIENDSVTINVNKDEPLWTPALERHIREHISTFTDATGTRCHLIVHHAQ